MGFSRLEYWSGLPFPSAGDLPAQGSNPLPYCRQMLHCLSYQGCPLSWWCHLTILSSVIPFSASLQSFPHHSHFQWVSTSPQVAKVLELQPQYQSFQWIFKITFLYYWLVWFPSSPSDSQESSPTLQFKSINSLLLGFLYSPTLTSIHGYWKNHSFDYTDLFW